MNYCIPFILVAFTCLLLVAAVVMGRVEQWNRVWRYRLRGDLTKPNTDAGYWCTRDRLGRPLQFTDHAIEEALERAQKKPELNSDNVTRLLAALPNGWRWKREACGGTWVYYATGLPMLPVWSQVTDVRDRLPCESVRLQTEFHGPVIHDV